MHESFLSLQTGLISVIVDANKAYESRGPAGMKATLKRLSITILICFGIVSAYAQIPNPQADGMQQPSLFSPSSPVSVSSPDNVQPPTVSSAVRQLLDFKESDIKFPLPRLLELLRDRKHEGWVLAAYPDPKTSQPLIGAGVSLDLPAREHVQHDPLNPRQFIEPSSAEIWQAAGLDPDRLRRILDEYNEHLADWQTKRFRKAIGVLPAQITDEEANSLLRVAAIQAIVNAKAYCRNFDQLSASQQMAMGQLVYQMGINLEEFSQFLHLVNRDSVGASDFSSAQRSDGEYWRNVQLSLVQSQWARLYRVRAASVIAMLNPRYEDNPSGAERSIKGILHPAIVRGHRARTGASLHFASYTRHRGSAAHRRSARLRSR
jgi:hypothetical protein